MDKKRLDDLIQKEIALFIYKHNLKPTPIEHARIAMAILWGARWMIKEYKRSVQDDLDKP